jgi:hypothetical protein
LVIQFVSTQNTDDVHSEVCFISRGSRHR